jgi:gamma-glutamylcysteine synthetase
MHPSNNPLTTADRESMIGYVLRGATPREDWKTGLEIELIGYDRDDLQRIDAETVDKLLHEYSSEHLLEGGTLSGARGATGALTVEPGCQVEFSGVARSRLDEARQDLSGCLDWLTDRARELNLILWVSDSTRCERPQSRNGSRSQDTG